jgi:hypothetical protein
MPRYSTHFGHVSLVLALILAGCTRAVYEPRLYPSTLPPTMQDRQPLTAHLHSGDVLVFESWMEADTALEGRGVRYDARRLPTSPTGHHSIPFDSIALLEMHVRTGSRTTGVTGLAVWSVLYGATTLACVADPKSCFGSCPTFYVDTEAGEVLAAEGFSSSIARALEAKDLDALFHARSSGGPFTMIMRNEALETHAVRGLRLMAVPRPPDRRVFAGRDGRFFPAGPLMQPLTCAAPEGDCLAALQALDGIERTSASDSLDLAARETLELTFPSATGQLGLVLASRQSLLTTYLFYQTMGFLGSRAGETLAALERGGPEEAKRAMGMARLVGTIDLEVWDGAAWTAMGTHEEAGPLATQVTVFPFAHIQNTDGPVRVRLSAPKGAWRMDWAALATLDDPLESLMVEPVAITGDGLPDSVALSLLLDPARHLVTYPGETYRITFHLPPADGEWELFLESHGFYYEWMRAEWLADEDPALAALVLYDPARALQVLAPAFKRAEPEMETRFWNSRFRR